MPVVRPIVDIMSDDLSTYRSATGRIEPVLTVEVQTVAADVDRILDAVMAVDPLLYGNYERNASVSAVGLETAQPRAGSTTATHIDDFAPGATETYPMVAVIMTIARDVELLERVIAAILHEHHYEEPVILIREAWASKSAYDPDSTNPNRWWNNGQGMPGKTEIAGFFDD